MIEVRDQAIARHRGEAAVSGKDDVPAGIAGHDLRQHLLIAFVGAVAEAHAAFAFEAREHGGVDVGRPVVDVEARARDRARTPRAAAAATEMRGGSCFLQPLRDQNDRAERHHDQRRNGIDHRAHAAARHRVDHHRQRFRIDAGHQAGDHVIVE